MRVPLSRIGAASCSLPRSAHATRPRRHETLGTGRCWGHWRLRWQKKLGGAKS